MALDLVAPRSAADGKGTVRVLEGPEGPVIAGTRASWTFEVTAADTGVAVGGAVIFTTPAFWGWSPAQLHEPLLPGFVEVSTDAVGLSLRPEVLDQGVVRVRIEGRPMRGGERLTLRYGASDAQAVVDRYAERGEVFWFGVDGDGDGVRGLIEDSPRVDVVAGEPVRLQVVVPIAARPGEVVTARVSALDVLGNLAAGLTTPVVLEGAAGVLELPSAVDLGPTGTVGVPLPAVGQGLVRLGASAGAVVGRSGPMMVLPEAPRVLWADLQVHTAMSDGSGDLDAVYRYAREVAGLDAVAITDHDHWGMRQLDRRPDLWAASVGAAAAHDDPGVFVAFPAYEWTSWLYGHRHVLYVGEPGPVFGSLDVATRTPQGLWDALRGRDAITLTHHQAGGPVATDWRIPPDPAFEPVAEACSVHGVSEAADAPGRIYGFVEGHSVRAALARGYRLGMLCSTDGHDGHPGLAHLQGGQGGLAALLTDDRSRAGVAGALRARATYGTSGERALLRLRVDDAEMGGEVAGRPEGHTLEVRVMVGGRVDRIDVIRGLDVAWTSSAPDASAWARVDPPASLGVDEAAGTVHLVRELLHMPSLAPGEFVYVRVMSTEGVYVVSSPIWGAAAAASADAPAAP